MAKKIDRLCKYMKNLRDDYVAQRSSDFNDIDMKIALKARIELLEQILQEAALVKKYKDIDDRLEDVGC
jgi:hypothetical protein